MRLVSANGDFRRTNLRRSSVDLAPFGPTVHASPTFASSAWPVAAPNCPPSSSESRSRSPKMCRCGDLWLISEREGALVFPDDTFPFWFPGVFEILLNPMMLGGPVPRLRGRPLVSRVRDKQSRAERKAALRGWPFAVWRAPTRVPRDLESEAQRWIGSEAGGWRGVRAATEDEVASLQRGEFKAEPYKKSRAAAEALVTDVESGILRKAGLTSEEVKKFRDGSVDLETLLKKAGLTFKAIASARGDGIAAFARAGLYSGKAATEIRREAVKGLSRRSRPRVQPLDPKTGRARAGHPDESPTRDRMAELRKALELRSDGDGFDEFFHDLVRRSIAPRGINWEELLLRRKTFETVSRMIVAVELDSEIYGKPRKIEKRAESLRVAEHQKE